MKKYTSYKTFCIQLISGTLLALILQSCFWDSKKEDPRVHQISTKLFVIANPHPLFRIFHEQFESKFENPSFVRSRFLSMENHFSIGVFDLRQKTDSKPVLGAALYLYTESGWKLSEMTENASKKTLLQWKKKFKNIPGTLLHAASMAFDQNPKNKL